MSGARSKVKAAAARRSAPTATTAPGACSAIISGSSPASATGASGPSPKLTIRGSLPRRR